jgi:DNA-binding MarR family transcriptional regulator
MHIVFFGLKRAHHGVLRVTRRVLAERGLTAARFDMLYAVREREGLPQGELCRALGVSGATVSRMATSLVELGLLIREAMPGDRRKRLVKLTAEGRSCIDAAIRNFMTWGWAQLAIDSALCPQQWQDEKLCARVRQRLEERLNRFRRAYRDIANLYWPWDFEDDVDYDSDPDLKNDGFTSPVRASS